MPQAQRLGATRSDRAHRKVCGRLVLLLLGSLAAMLLAAGTPALAAGASPSSSPAAGKPAPTGKGEVTFGVQPASLSKGKLVPDARPYFYYGMSPGAALTDHVAILNYSTKPVVLTVYATDALNAPDGGFGLQPVETKPVDAGSWVSLGGPRLQVRVPARSVNKLGQQVVGSVLLPVQLTVPKSANPGDHVGGIVASLDTVSSSKDGNRVRLQQRVASRMFIRVSGPLHPSLSVQNLKVRYRGSLISQTGGTATVTYTVHNGGNVKLGGRQRLSVSGLFGLAGRTPAIADIPLLLPGSSADVTVLVSHLTGQLRMHASVVVAGLQLPGDTNPPVPDAKAGSYFWVWPWLLLGVLAVLLAAAGYLYRRRRRRRAGGSDPGGNHRVVAPAGGPQGPDGARRPAGGISPKTTVKASLVAGVLGVLSLLGMLVPVTAQAADLPYHDPAVTGQLGLCDSKGQPVTGGSINQRPFVWRAVSSVQAPAEYSGTGRKASLLIYQPRPNVSADQWSGDQMTATSDYTNPAVPMSQATGQDFTLKEFLGEFKPMVDGLLQLRMYFGIPGRSTWNSSYPAVDIRVTGNSWQVLNPTTVSCTNGSSTSSELQTPGPAGQPVAAVPTKSSSASAGKAPRTASSKPVSPTTRPGAVAGPSTPTGSGPANVAAASSKSSKGGPTALLAASLAGLLIAGLAGLFWWRRRQSA